jgi:hypothetical protein
LSDKRFIVPLLVPAHLLQRAIPLSSSSVQAASAVVLLAAVALFGLTTVVFGVSN